MYITFIKLFEFLIYTYIRRIKFLFLFYHYVNNLVGYHFLSVQYTCVNRECTKCARECHLHPKKNIKFHLYRVY